MYFSILRIICLETYFKNEKQKKAVPTRVAMRLIGSVYLAEKCVTLLFLISVFLFQCWPKAKNAFGCRLFLSKDHSSPCVYPAVWLLSILDYQMSGQFFFPLFSAFLLQEAVEIYSVIVLELFFETHNIVLDHEKKILWELALYVLPVSRTTLMRTASQKMGILLCHSVGEQRENHDVCGAQQENGYTPD